MSDGGRLTRLLGPVSLAFIAAAPAQAFQTPCFDSATLERDGYRIANVRLDGPLHTGSAMLESLRLRGVSLPGAGEPFTRAGFDEVRKQIRQVLGTWPTLFDSPVRVSVVRAEVTNCRPGTREVDVEYSFATTNVPVAITAWDLIGSTARDPGQRAGLTRVTPLRVGPTLAYDRELGLRIGARVTSVPKLNGPRLAAEAAGSRDSFAGTLYAEGEHATASGFFSQLDWRLAAEHSSLPSAGAKIRRSRVAGELAALTRPSPVGRVRMAAALEGGHQEGDDFTAIPGSFVRRSGYAQLTGFAQLDGSGRRHATSARYGLELGTTGHGIAYLKHALDAEAALFFPLAGEPHRRIMIESRVASGFLDARSRVPVTERFFGGAAAFDEESWQRVRGPLVRSVPPLALASAGDAAGSGIDRFAGISLTAALDVWHRALVPEEVSQDPDVGAAIESQLNSAEVTLATIHEIRDPAHREIFDNQERILATVESLLDAVNAAESSAEQTQEQLELCQSLADQLVANVSDWTPSVALAPVVRAPASEDDPTMPGVEAACGRVNTVLRDADIAAGLAGLARERQWIQDQLAKVDNTRAAALAAEDMRFPRRAVQTIFEELNLVSIAPVLLFDAARVWELEPSHIARTRYALGGGLRVTLASTFSFTFTYAVDPGARSGERSGAATVAMRVIDIF